jgi:predicted RND superfamily exporter protein
MWSRLADAVLDYPYLTLPFLLLVTLWLGYWSFQVQTDHSPGHFLSADAQEMRDFQRASSVFGEGQTILYVVFDRTDVLAPAFLASLDTLTQRVARMPGVEHVLSLTNVPTVQRDSTGLASEPLYHPALPNDSLRATVARQPFLKGLLLSDDGQATSLLVNLNAQFNTTPERVALVDSVEVLANALPGRVALAGIPYLRTQYGKRVTSEAPFFATLALLISLTFLYLTYRSSRAVLLPLLNVVLGIVWTIGLIALFKHQLNIVTAVLPALMVIIGVENVIHFTTKFYDQYRLFQDRRRSIAYTIETVGLASLMTSVTTAVGFGSMVFSGSRLLSVFGVFAAVGILLLYVISLTLIPALLLKLPPPSDYALRLATHNVFTRFFDRLAGFTRNHAGVILIGTAGLVLVALVGMARISSDIRIFSDFSPDDPLQQHLQTFEQHFGGVLPLDVVVVAKQEGRLRSLEALRRIDRLQQQLDTLDAVGETFSAANLAKLATQAYFGGHPRGYRLPSNIEMPFLQTSFRSLADQQTGLARNLPRFVDSTFTMTRIHLGIADLGTRGTNALVDTLTARARAVFPAAHYEVFVTGSAILNTRSGENLVRNLLGNLGLALLAIALLMAWAFRTARLTLISMLPNLIPLLVVGGVVGFAGIILKPSIALVFPMAVGITVDNTIHFLARYRLLRDRGLSREEGIRGTLQETGKAMMFSSFVLMSGFLIFTLSSFGGTKHMGGLTALTFVMALLSNTVLLPALLSRFGPAEHRDVKQPVAAATTDRSTPVS